jgi:hypothetical protein
VKFLSTIILALCVQAKISAQEIVQLEYYFDSDPGYGAAIQIPFTSDTVIDIETSISLAMLNDGLHSLYVRARDTLGNWSFIQKRSFLKDAEIAAMGTDVTNMEYYFDIDPGYKNGMPMPLVSGSDIVVFDSLNLESL